MGVLQKLLWRGLAAPRLVRLSAIPRQYEKKIRAFEACPVREGSTVFIGSSSIRLWTSLAEDMAPVVTHNFGFGGGHAFHLGLFGPRVVPRQRPRMVVVYAGDNDLASGTSVPAVVDAMRVFLDQLERDCPLARVVLLTVKLSPSRMRWADATQRLNQAYREEAARRRDVQWLDVATPLLDQRGTPRLGCFQYDGLHLSRAGYRAWSAVVRPVVVAAGV